MTYSGKSVSRPSERSGFYPGTVASTDGESVNAIVPHLGDDFEIEISKHVGPIPEEGSNIFVSFLNGLDDELAAIFPSSAGKIEYDFLVAASNARGEIKGRADFVCTGENDEETIQAAINAVVSGDYGYDSPSGRVVLSGGDFHLGAPFTIPEDTIQTFLLVGAGKEITRLWAEFVPQPEDVAVFNTNQTQYCTIVGMTITLNLTEAIASDFYIVSTNYPYWKYVRLEDVALQFFGVGDASDVFCNGLYSYVVHLDRSEIETSGYGIKNVMALWCDFSKIDVTAGDAVESTTPWFNNQSLFVFNSRISSSEGAGLNMCDTSRSVIHHTQFATSGPAIKLENPISLMFINENTFTGHSSANPGGLIEVGVGYQILITNNIFSDAAGSAIKGIASSQQSGQSFFGNATISGNSFSNSGASDIDFSNLSTIGIPGDISEIIDISANTFKTSIGYAIDMGECEFLSITSNSIFSTQATAIRVKEANVFTILDNAISVSEPI